MVILDSSWILADKVSAKFVKILLDSLRATLENGFADANDIFIGVQFDNNAISETQADQFHIEFGDLHEFNQPLCRSSSVSSSIW